MLEALLIGQVWAFMLVFMRVGAAAMILPGIGDGYVSPRIRLLFGLGLALVVTPVLAPTLPPLPDNAISLFLLIAAEIGVGLFIGTIARLMLAALDIAGVIVSNEISLAAAQAFNPAMSSQGSLIGGFFTLLGVVALFVTDLHHLLLRAIVDSYSLFGPGTMPAAGDMAETVVELVGHSFRIGFEMAAPFIVLGLLFYLGLGLVARLQPQLQVFFVAQPIQIAVGLFVVALTLSAGMMFWLGHVQSVFSGFLSEG